MSKTQEWMRPVVAVPLQQAFPQLDEVKEFRSKVCIFNHNRTKLFDVVSPRYQVIDHGDAFRRIDTGLSQYFGKEGTSSVRSLNGGSQIRAEFKLPIDPVKVGKNDASSISLVLRNSYDRSCTFSAMLGAFRFVCSNGMVVGEKFGAIKARHLGSADAGAPTLLDELDAIITRAPMLPDLWKEWQDTPVEYEEAFELLRGRFPDKYLAPILVEGQFPRNKWQLYNDCTAFSTHHTSSVRRRMEFDDKIASLFYEDDV